MATPPFNRRRLIAAFAVAAAADGIDIAITAGENASLGLGLLPGEILSGGLDVIVMGVMWRLLGFHWLFLPSFVLQLVPEVEALPTWLGCVALVAWQRRTSAPLDRPAPKRIEPLPPAA